MFIASYAPLYAILLVVLDGDSFIYGRWVKVFIFVILLNSVLLTLFFLYTAKTGELYSIKINESRSADTELLSYTVTYYPIFFNVNHWTENELIGFLMLFTLVAVIQVRSFNVFLNPLFLLFGYRSYYASVRFKVDNQSRNLLILTKSDTLTHTAVLRRMGDSHWGYVTFDDS